ncbi:hypothetical protein [Shimia ponticola]|uniref:hypothetical protein n=1 Tax=Shimia ponticola TaxID=2582893 RepID=UPI0011BF9598|nr:hypothetical protein [Shimia ponticola]
MRLFFSFMRAPLWLKVVMIVVIIGGALVLRDGRVSDMAKEQAVAFAETQVGAMMDQALADAAEAMGMESLDLFGAVGGGVGAGAADGFVANNGHKTERVATPVQKIDWRERATTLWKDIVASPLDYLPLIFSVAIGLLFVVMVLSSIKRMFSRLGRKDPDAHKSKYAMETSVEMPGMDLDAAFADPKAAPDMKALLAKQNEQKPASTGGLSLRASVKDTAKKAAASQQKAAKAARKRSSIGLSLFGSRQPSAMLKAKLETDPFDRLTS